jgi:hypothetical protein
MYQTADIVKVIGLKLGQPVTAADFAAANQRITDTELFSGVTYEFGLTGKPPPFLSQRSIQVRPLDVSLTD